jgi:pimeloyl-ACP methyl ester carboxylesterase
MIGLWALVGLLVVSAPPASTDSVVSPLEFRASFKQAIAGRLTIPTDVKKAARDYRYVFVAGFMNEGTSEYFKQNAQELAAIGVSSKSINFIYPSSGKTIEENSAFVRDKFHEFAARGAERLVVIAHSRGACDTLAFALANAEFVAEKVEALFLVQGPFGGTGIADYLIGEGPPIDASMPLKDRLIAQGVSRLEEHKLSHGQHRGLPSLTRQASKKYWDMMLEKHEGAIPVISPKTHYVTTKANRAQLRLLLRATASYLDSHFGPNDGLVALEDQSVAGVGTVLAVLDAGHTDLTHRFPAAAPKRRMRRALIDAIVMGVGSPGTHEAQSSDD